MKYESVIGLEVHVQLKTKSKLFCTCDTGFGSEPNSHICPVCTGQPGTLPVLNKKALELTILTGLGLNCTISSDSIFARKNYFYPDLPKNYQISQYELPICEKGLLEIPTSSGFKKIGITRIHLEEDAGKLVHEIGSNILDYSLVDYNRTGIPLMEIVSEPELNTPDEAYSYLSELKAILRYMKVSDCDMEKGFLRCDANISLRPRGETKYGSKVELKNLNSFKAVREALSYEEIRQERALESGERIIQETRLWDANTSTTISMRSKEQAHDYRYFPEPDLVPLKINADMINQIKSNLVEMPRARKNRFMKSFALSEYDAGVLTSDKPLADFFEDAIKPAGEPKMTANWIINDLLGRLNTDNKSITESPVSAKQLAELIKIISDGTISGKIAKTVFNEMYATAKNPCDIVKEKGLVQIADNASIEKFVTEAINANPKAVAEYKSGKQQAIGSLIGYIMKKSGGKVNPKIANDILRKKIV
ncbi:MAG: Aspartyl/glutamyl-tRNA(Asn/Gln) amidotransferase subunit B [Elusimicrobia bacterium ADurb.Bin231]|nr:MAG: Aspartyl/glutamyl-tRNA(Asn/Gln) amidotransferase subunit B [Elusimicrobia bacterium ADurb.Bin231]